VDDLFHLIYASKSVNKLLDEDLVEILQQCRKKNAEADITGMLLYTNGNFFQVLEGEKMIILQLYNTIRQDPRHDQITTIVTESISKRNCSQWSMGFAKVTNKQLNDIEGLNDFFTENTCFVDIDMGRSKKLLKAFADGYWQQQ